MAFAPIFIVGVPRSGTTLLRVLLDSHSAIAALPETPWLLGAYGPDPSLRGVLCGLIAGPYGAVRNVSGMEPGHVHAAGRSFLETLFAPVLEKRNKRMLVFKTPADIRHLDFLLKLVPDAFYIHITRDGRDVAMSHMAKKDSHFSDLKEYGRLGFANLLRRWVDWEQRISRVLYRDGVRVIHIRYEDLIADPPAELRRITGFLGLTFEGGMLDYAARDHDYPSWEAGSADVARNKTVSGASAGKWRQAKMTAEMLHALMKYDSALVALGYSSSGLSPNPQRRALAALVPLMSPLLDIASRFRLLLRPLFKNGARMLACAGLALLAAQFLLPGTWLESRGLARDAFQPLLCFAAALGFAAAFGPALSRRSISAHPLVETFFRTAAPMLGVIGILEAAQNFIPARHAGLSEFLFNAGAAAAAVLVSIPFLRKADAGTAQPGRQRPQTPALTAQ